MKLPPAQYLFDFFNRIFSRIRVKNCVHTLSTYLRRNGSVKDEGELRDATTTTSMRLESPSSDDVEFSNSNKNTSEELHVRSVYSTYNSEESTRINSNMELRNGKTSLAAKVNGHSTNNGHNSSVKNGHGAVTTYTSGTTTYVPPPVSNPFYFRIHLTALNKLQVLLMTIFVLPIRFCLVLFFLFFTWLGCRIGLIGISDEELESKPLTGWRRLLQIHTHAMVTWAYRMFMVHVVIRGRRAPRDEAPLLVVAPHSSFYDIGVCITTVPMMSVVVRDERRTPLYGTILRFIQPVFVKRSCRESRQSSLNAIKQRAVSKDPWQQMVVFPEGTCSNRSCLLKFKNGAFTPGVPVQPIVIRYPNKVNTLTWTWDGPSALTTLYLTMCQLRTHMVLEFLPVYIPDERERQDAALFANNVRIVMSNALGLPLSEFSYDDLRYLGTGIKHRPHHSVAVVKLLKMRDKHGVSAANLDDEIERSRLLLQRSRLENESQRVDFGQFYLLAGVPPSEAAQEFFAVLDTADDAPGTIDLRAYVACLQLIKLDGTAAFKTFCNRDEGVESCLRLREFVQLCWIMLELPRCSSSSLFELLAKGKPTVTLEEFSDFARGVSRWKALFDPKKKESSTHINVGLKQD